MFRQNFEEIANLSFDDWTADIEAIFDIAKMEYLESPTHEDIINRIEQINTAKLLLAPYQAVNSFQLSLLKDIYKDEMSMLVSKMPVGRGYNDAKRQGEALKLLKKFKMKPDYMSRLTFNQHTEQIVVDLPDMLLSYRQKAAMLDRISRTFDDVLRGLQSQGSLLRNETEKIKYDQ